MSEWTIDTLKALLEARLKAMDKALELQAREYDRRLHELNHAHEQAVEVQHTYVTEEVHLRDMESARAARTAMIEASDRKAEGIALALNEAKKTSDTRFARIETFQNKLLGAVGFAIVAIPLLTALVVYLLNHG